MRNAERRRDSGRLALVLAAVVVAALVPAGVRAEPNPPPQEAFARPPLHLEHESRLSLPAWVTWGGLAITAGLGTSMVWSFSKLSDARRLDDVTHDLDTERTLERRRRQTIGLGLGTGLAAIGTTLIALLATDWDGPDVGGWASGDGGGLSVAGTF